MSKGAVLEPSGTRPTAAAVASKVARLGKLKSADVQRLKKPGSTFPLEFLDALGFGVSIRDRHLALLFANRSWTKRRLRFLRQGRDSGSWLAYREEERRSSRIALKRGRPSAHLASLSDADGECRHYKIISFPTNGVFSDSAVITASVEVSDLIRASESREERSQMLAHDVGNHILAVARNLELLLDGMAGSLNETQSEILRDTLECSNHLLGMAENMQELPRLESGQPKLRKRAFNFSEVMETAVHQALGLATGKRVRIEWSSGFTQARALGDARCLQRVLVNVLVNAIKFSPVGGRILVTCKRWCARGFQVAVIDEGSGIPARHLKRVFEKYYTVPSRHAHSRSGMGLGLYYCQQVILAHGGRIWIESPPAGYASGTKVLFTIPAASGKRYEA